MRLTFSAGLTSERVFVALGILAMLCNAMLDIAMTMPPHLLYYGIMLALIECDIKEVKRNNKEKEEPVVSDVDSKCEEPEQPEPKGEIQ